MLSNAVTIVQNYIHQYLHSNGIRMQWSIKKMWQIFSSERHWSRDGKINMGFSTFEGLSNALT